MFRYSIPYCHKCTARSASKKIDLSPFYVLSELAEKGIMKMKRFKNAPQKIPYSYILTPRGIEQKAKITTRFLKQKMTEYEEIKRQIKEIAEELKAGQKTVGSETDSKLDLLKISSKI